MTNLSDLFPAGAGKQVSFVADGSISAAGEPVTLTAAGKAAPIAGATEAIGSETLIENIGANSIADNCGVCYDTANDKAIALVQEYVSAGAKYNLACYIGTNSASSVTWGSPIAVGPYDDTTTGLLYGTIIFVPSTGQIVVAGYETGGGNAYGIVGTISGAAITWGTKVVMHSATGTGLAGVYDPDTTMLIYSTNRNGADVGCWTATVSGTGAGGTLTVSSSEVEVSSTSYTKVGVGYDTTENKVVFAGSQSSTTYIRAGTVSGSGATGTVTMGSEVTASVEGNSEYRVHYDSSYPAIAITAQFDSYYIGIIPCTLSGTVITVGTLSSASSDAYYYTDSVYDPNAKKIAVTGYLGASPNTNNMFTATISGSLAVTWTAAFAIGTLERNYNTGYTLAFDEDSNQIINVYRQDADQDPHSKVYTTGYTSLTAAALLGISDAAISDTASGNITVKGGIAVNGLSSLTPGTDYYAQTDGTISTSSSGDAVKLGRALSATSIDLEYQS